MKLTEIELKILQRFARGEELSVVSKSHIVTQGLRRLVRKGALAKIQGALSGEITVSGKVYRLGLELTEAGKLYLAGFELAGKS